MNFVVDDLFDEELVRVLSLEINKLDFIKLEDLYYGNFIEWFERNGNVKPEFGILKFKLNKKKVPKNFVKGLIEIVNKYSFTTVQTNISKTQFIIKTSFLDIIKSNGGGDLRFNSVNRQREIQFENFWREIYNYIIQFKK